MISAMLARLGAWCGVAAGLGIGLPAAVEAVTGETASTSFVIGLAPAFALPLLIALHLRQHEAAGTFGAVAFTVNTVGLGLFGGAAFTLNMALFYLEDAVLKELLRGPTTIALLASAVVFTAGSVLFGVAMVRARVHPRVPALGYIVMLPALALGAQLPDSVATSALHVLVGTTLIWLALSLTSRPLVEQRPHPATAIAG